MTSPEVQQAIERLAKAVADGRYYGMRLHFKPDPDDVVTVLDALASLLAAERPEGRQPEAERALRAAERIHREALAGWAVDRVEVERLQAALQVMARSRRRMAQR
ncbi:MAG: hypothetical protein AB7G37_03340 [Solirubrobacteraceae bacterium]